MSHNEKLAQFTQQIKRLVLIAFNNHWLPQITKMRQDLKDIANTGSPDPSADLVVTLSSYLHDQAGFAWQILKHHIETEKLYYYPTLADDLKSAMAELSEPIAIQEIYSDIRNVLETYQSEPFIRDTLDRLIQLQADIRDRYQSEIDRFVASTYNAPTIARNSAVALPAVDVDQAKATISTLLADPNETYALNPDMIYINNDGATVIWQDNRLRLEGVFTPDHLIAIAEWVNRHSLQAHPAGYAS